MDEMEDSVPNPTPAINFEIGGQVKSSAVLDPSSSLLLLDPFKFAGSITSLDLDDIQPPSEMDGLSYSNNNTNNFTSGHKLTDSPLRNRKGGLSSTLIARRAIAGHTNLSHALMKSVESVASHTNLENVAPPSLMDELLDSMMSVDSITSEVASDPLNNRTLCGQVELSHYETALSDDDDTMTLRSCRDLPLDSGTGNGSCSSNCSSNQSTPVRKRHGSVTPKMKREMARERFKTYTVGSTELTPGGKKPEEEEQVQVVPTKATGETPSPEKAQRVSAKQRRQENRSRFQTQILDYSEMKIFEIAPKEEEIVEEQENGMEVQEEMEDDTAFEEEGTKIEENGENLTDVKVAIVSSEKKATATVIKKTLLRLIKPTGSNINPPPATPEDTNKAIRGRRKAEYVSPYRRPGTIASASPLVTNQMSKAVTGKSLIATPGQRKSTGFISKLKQVATKKSPTKVAPAVKEVDHRPPKELNRQGTFTKEEPSSVNLPKVSSLPATPTKRLSKLPLVGNGGSTPGGGGGLRKSFAGSPATAIGNGIVKNGGVIKRQISAPATPGNGQLGEKRKSMIATPSARSSTGQLTERSTSSVSIKSNVSGGGKTAAAMTPSKTQEKRLPLSTPASRSNSTMGTPRTPTTPSSASKISLYGRAKVSFCLKVTEIGFLN